MRSLVGLPSSESLFFPQNNELHDLAAVAPLPKSHLSRQVGSDSAVYFHILSIFMDSKKK